jgi:hypothetical protein
MADQLSPVNPMKHEAAPVLLLYVPRGDLINTRNSFT